MNVGIGSTEAVQFLFWEYINLIYSTMQGNSLVEKSGPLVFLPAHIVRMEGGGLLRRASNASGEQLVAASPCIQIISKSIRNLRDLLVLKSLLELQIMYFQSQ
jgi:hypothetical protein